MTSSTDGRNGKCNQTTGPESQIHPSSYPGMMIDLLLSVCRILS
jgi:hypothetical protein